MLVAGLCSIAQLQFLSAVLDLQCRLAWFDLKYMGVGYGKVYDNPFSKEMLFLMRIPLYFLNPSQVGEAYIVAFKSDAMNRKVAHYAIASDVARASNEWELCGVTIHSSVD